FILSVEIVIIALSAVTKEPILSQILVVSLIAIVATVGVYGIVALIVRMDEFGAKLIEMGNKKDSFLKIIGNLLVQALPKVIRSLSFIGTIALILVAGGIFAHNIDFLHYFLPQLPSIIREFIVGLLVAVITVTVVGLVKRIWKNWKNRTP
ncbi:MAG: DUF808 family protein, partial [Saonia sp.]